MTSGFNTRPIGGGEYDVDLVVDGDHEGTWTVEDDETISLSNTESVDIYLNGNWVTSTSVGRRATVSVDDYVKHMDISRRYDPEEYHRVYRLLSDVVDFDPPICASIENLVVTGSGGGAGRGHGAFLDRTPDKPADRVSPDDDFVMEYESDIGAAIGRVRLRDFDDLPSGNPSSTLETVWFSDFYYYLSSSTTRRTDGSFYLEMYYAEGDHTF